MGKMKMKFDFTVVYKHELVLEKNEYDAETLERWLNQDVKSLESIGDIFSHLKEEYGIDVLQSNGFKQISGNIDNFTIKEDNDEK